MVKQCCALEAKLILYIDVKASILSFCVDGDVNVLLCCCRFTSINCLRFILIV